MKLGEPFQIGIITGTSNCQSVEGDLANVHAIKFRAPFSTNGDFRMHTYLGEIGLCSRFQLLKRGTIRFVYISPLLAVSCRLLCN